jgi:hypothetical protein
MNHLYPLHQLASGSLYVFCFALHCPTYPSFHYMFYQNRLFWLRKKLLDSTDHMRSGHFAKWRNIAFDGRGGLHILFNYDPAATLTSSTSISFL